MFDSFYHLHIPKTGGRYLRYNVIDILTPYIEEKGIKVINKDVPITEPKFHASWDQQITDSTYIMTSLRDPISNLASLFFHIIVIDKDPQAFPNKIKYNSDLMTKEIFFESIKDLPYFFSGFQSKNFLYNEPFYNGNHDTSVQPATDIKKLFERINRINLLIKMEDMRVITPSSIAKKLIEDLELPITLEKFTEEYNKKTEYLTVANSIIQNDIVQDLVNSFTNTEKQNLYKYIREDLFLYSGCRNLFYKFGEEA